MSVNNLSKLIQHLEPLHKGPLIVDGDTFDRVKIWLKLSPTFFFKDSCYSCGKCCVCAPENLLLTQSEFDRLLSYSKDDFRNYGLNPDDLVSLRESMNEEKHEINGKEITVYKCKNKKQFIEYNGKDHQDACYHLFKTTDGKYRCKIHPVRSLTCRMPHLRVFYTNHGCVSVGISQFGRNWSLGCKVEFLEPLNELEFNSIKEERIEALKYLLRVAQDLNCNTYLPELIEYTSNCTFSNYKNLLNKDLMPKSNSKGLFQFIVCNNS